MRNQLLKYKKIAFDIFYYRTLIFFVIALMSCGETNGSDIENTNTTSKKAVKIMPIGDSLTEATTPGYRGYLYTWLTNDSIKVDFVGVNQSKPTNGADPDHSAFGGFTIGPGASKVGNIYDNLEAGAVIMSKNCDVILLMIGINDFFNISDSNYNPSVDGPLKLEALIEKMYSMQPNVCILISNLTPVAWNMSGFASEFNSKVPLIVERQKLKGRACHFVDTRNGNTWDAKVDFQSDQLHLTDEGYRKVAGSFYKVLKPILQK